MTFNLCEARFFPFTLDLYTFMNMNMNMPLAISPVNTVIDLSHLGVDVTNTDLLKKLHNRGNSSMRLKDFSDTNLRNFHNAGDELVAVHDTKDNLQLGKKQMSLYDPKECLRAFFNFAALSRNFNVLDTSPMALLKVVMDKFLSGPPTVEQFFKLPRPSPWWRPAWPGSSSCNRAEARGHPVATLLPAPLPKGSECQETTTALNGTRPPFPPSVPGGRAREGAWTPRARP